MTYEEILEQCAYKNQEDLTSEEKEVWDFERARCQVHFTRFLKWAKVVSPPSPGERRDSVIPFDFRPHMKKTVSTFLTKPLISILKARQIWLSTIVSLYVTWYALSKEHATIFLFSQGETEAKELLNKCKTVYAYMPNFMKLDLASESSETFSIEPMKSIIRAMPSTESSGIGYTASIVVWDEHAKHKYADQNYTHAKPIIDRGAQAISIFTADPMGNDNLATEIFKGAMLEKTDPAEWNGYTHLFFPYDVVPGRDDEWYRRTMKSIPARDLARLSPDIYMSKNYPTSIEQALSVEGNVAAFDHKVLEIMKEYLRSKVNYGWDLDERINIYHDYHSGEAYVAACDVGWGLSADYTPMGIMDSNGRIVADILVNDVPPDEFGDLALQLLTHYHNPWFWIENNTAGGGMTLIKKMVELGYRKLGYRDDKPISWRNVLEGDTSEIGRVGFVTNEQSRLDLFGELIPAINDHMITIYNQKGLDQFTTTIRNADKKGRIEGMSGRHDDYVIMTGIAWLKRKEQKRKARVEPVSTLTFGSTHPPVIEKILAGR